MAQTSPSFEGVVCRISEIGVLEISGSWSSPGCPSADTTGAISTIIMTTDSNRIVYPQSFLIQIFLGKSHNFDFYNSIVHNSSPT